MMMVDEGDLTEWKVISRRVSKRELYPTSINSSAMDDLADDKSMGGYGHEQERERLRLQEKIAAGEDMDGEEGDRKEIFTPVIMSLVSALGGWEVSLHLHHMAILIS